MGVHVHPSISAMDSTSSNAPIVVGDTVNMLSQLDGPSRELPSGAKPSQERPATGQEGVHSLNPGFTSHGIPKVRECIATLTLIPLLSACGGRLNPVGGSQLVDEHGNSYTNAEPRFEAPSRKVRLIFLGLRLI